MVGFRVKGLSEALAELRTLETKVAKKMVRKAGREGMKPVRAAAIAATAVFKNPTGATQKAIKIRSGRARRGVIRFIVGVGEKWFRGATFYAAFVEMGHYLGKRSGGHKAAKLANGRRRVEGLHWLRAAYLRSRDQGLAAFVRSLGEQLAAHRKGST
jgi:HK97 gp10 family phage protein